MERPVFNFTEPKKKKRKKQTGVESETSSPFPVPIETLTGRRNDDLQWSIYQGRLIGSSVVIESQNDMDAVYQMGFFGKGNLSWSAPEYNVATEKDGRPRRKSSTETLLRKLSRQRYLQHLEWKNCSETQQTTGDVHLGEGFMPCPTESTVNSNLLRTFSPDSQRQQLDADDVKVPPSGDLPSGFIHEDECGDSLVVEDSDDDDGNLLSPHEKKDNVGTIVFDPYPLKENLQLSLEEAFFLSYALGCLVVSHKEQGPMNLVSMWSRFSEIDPNFITRYITYHNFRSKGWVVKSGIKYGVDFNLYKKGPPFYHSTYSVLVVAVDGKTEQETSSTLDWTSLSCLNRVTQQVSKELMICYVIKPKDLSDDDLRTPKCIPRFKVSEFIIGRWVSKKERENSDYFEMP